MKLRLAVLNVSKSWSKGLYSAAAICKRYCSNDNFNAKINVHSCLIIFLAFQVLFRFQQNSELTPAAK